MIGTGSGVERASGRAANATAPMASPAANCCRVRPARRRAPSSGAPVISPSTYAEAGPAPSVYPPGASLLRNTTAGGAMATGVLPASETTAHSGDSPRGKGRWPARSTDTVISPLA
ncbi:hypothetical protein C1N81_00880 (plasmid) [Streptomyces sp. SGAir0957]